MIAIKRPFWVCVDVETTGFSRANDRILQFAAYSNTDSGFQSYVCTDVPIPPTISTLTGIRKEHVAGAPSFDEVWRAFGSWLYAQRQKVRESTSHIVLVAHNAIFDIDMIIHGLARVNMSIDDIVGLVHGEHIGTYVDTMKISKIVFPKSTTVPNHKLGTLYRHCTGRPLEGAHNALADVKGLFVVLGHMLPHMNQTWFARIDTRWNRYFSSPKTTHTSVPPMQKQFKKKLLPLPVVSPFFDGVSKPPFKRLCIRMSTDARNNRSESGNNQDDR